MYPLPAGGMVEFEVGGMEEVPANAGVSPTIQSVADDGVLNRGEVYPYLVRSACPGSDVGIGASSIVGERPVKRGRRATVFDYRHLLTIMGVAAYRGVNDGLHRIQHTDHQRQVALVHGPISQLPRQRCVGAVALGYGDEAGSVHIQSVDEAGAHRASDVADGRVESKHRVDEGRVGVSDTGMDGHTGRLVHYEEVFVFVGQVERYLLREHMSRNGFGDGNGDRLARPEPEARVLPSPVNGDISI